MGEIRQMISRWWPLIVLGAFAFPGGIDALAQEGRLVNGLGMEFVLIQPGSFMMGSVPDETYATSKEIYRDADEVAHEVMLGRPFFMQATEVTQKQWKDLMGRTPAYSKDCGEDCPVERVSWFDVQEFIQKLNKKGEGRYRLPTEAEWEFAARAGTPTAFSWGNQVDCSRAMFQNNPRRGLDYCTPYIDSRKMRREAPAPVRSYPPNPWGLFDMHGNVWEWTQDWYGPYPGGTLTDPKGPEKGVEKVRRGGSWFGKGTFCRSANRNRSHPASRYRTTGFRLVREK